jgi:hypothetical protein
VRRSALRLMSEAYGLPKRCSRRRRRQSRSQGSASGRRRKRWLRSPAAAWQVWKQQRVRCAAMASGAPEGAL